MPVKRPSTWPVVRLTTGQSALAARVVRPWPWPQGQIFWPWLGLETSGLGLEAFGLGLVFLALALASFKAKAKVKVTNILPNTVYHGIITLTVHWYTSIIGTAIAP